MLEVESKTYLEETNEIVAAQSCFEGETICWNRTKSRSDIITAFNSECNIGNSLVESGKRSQEQLDFWKANPELWEKNHKLAVAEGTTVNDLRLTYFIKEVKLIENGKVIKEQTFRYGL